MKGATNLYIVPTGPLYGLPFEALVTQVDEQKPHYLIEDHPIVYLSSASLLKTVRESQARKKKSPKYPLLAFAHPVYKKTDKQKEGNEAFTTKGTSTVASLRSVSYLDLMGGVFKDIDRGEHRYVSDIDGVGRHSRP